MNKEIQVVIGAERFTDALQISKECTFQDIFVIDTPHVGPDYNKVNQVIIIVLNHPKYGELIGSASNYGKRVEIPNKENINVEILLLMNSAVSVAVFDAICGSLPVDGRWILVESLNLQSSINLKSALRNDLIVNLSRVNSNVNPDIFSFGYFSSLILDKKSQLGRIEWCDLSFDKPFIDGDAKYEFDAVVITGSSIVNQTFLESVEKSKGLSSNLIIVAQSAPSIFISSAPPKELNCYLIVERFPFWYLPGTSVIHVYRSIAL